MPAGSLWTFLKSWKDRFDKGGFQFCLYFALGLPLLLFGFQHRLPKRLLGNSYPQTSGDVDTPGEWKVVRCAALDRATRIRRGGSESIQTKIECILLRVLKNGVKGYAKRWWRKIEVDDYNNYRSTAHDHRFEPGTPDRAVSILTESIYDDLRQKIPGAVIGDGDLGENMLIRGPTHTGTDLKVGTQLRIGDKVVIELTEANKPCSRLRWVRWNAKAAELFGEKWWQSEELPLLGQQMSGGRGWLCKVLVEGEVKPGAQVQILHRSST